MKTQPHSMARSFGLSLRYFSVLLLTHCISLLGYSQDDIASNYSSFGIFDQLIDRFGHAKTWNEVRIIDDSSSTSLTSTVGMFEVHYYSGSGFDNPNNTSHAERRAVVEQMLGVFNSSWNHLLSNEKIVIRFLPMDPSIAGGAAYPILGSSYYVVPKWNSNFSEVSDCLVAQYLQSNKNPYYTLGDFNTKGFLNDGAFKFSHLDFYCNLDSFVLNTDLAETSIAANQIDLYSVALREFTVALGVNSLISKTGQGITSNLHQFSRWDSYLHFQNQPLISYDNSQKKYIPNSLTGWLSNLGLFTNDCDSVFDCSESPNIAASLLKVSISKCFNQGIDLNYLNQNCSLDTALLESNWMSGVVRRKLYSSDLQILEYLGYEMDGCFGEASYNSNFCAQFSGEHRFTRYASSTPDQAFQGIIEFDSSQKIAINKLIPNVSSGTSVELMDYAGGSSTFVLNNDSVEVSNFKKGRSVLRFLVGSAQGTHSTAFALVGLLGGEVCEGENCNLVTNSSFENLSSIESCGVLEEIQAQQAAGFPYVSIDCWSSFCGSPDIHFENCSNNLYDFISGPQGEDFGGNIPIIPGPNDKVVHLFSRAANALSTPPVLAFEEAIQGTLASPLIPGTTYQISMQIFRRSGGSPHLKIYFRNGEFVSDINEIVDPASYQLIAGPAQEILAFQENEWQTWTATFTAPIGQTNLNQIIIANELLSINNTNTVAKRRLFIDDVRISTTPIATFNIPQDFVCNGTIGSLQNFASPTGGVVTGPGVIGGPNFSFVSGFAGVGTHIITYSITTSNGCVLSASDDILVHPSINFNNAVINPTCGQSCSGSITLNPDIISSAEVTYLWTGPSINIGNQNSTTLTNLCAGVYTVVATINDDCTRTQSFTVGSVTSPVASASTNIDLCSGGCGNSILVTTNNPSNTISWTGGLTGFNPTNVCGGQYTATVTSPQGCVSAPVVVTVNTLPTTNLTVSASQTIDASNLSYNTITITSTGYLTITTSNNTSCLIGTMIDVQFGGRLMVANAQLKFLPQAMIRVRQGGRALIVGGLLTSNCPGTLWHGIEVLGNSNNSHEAVQESMVTFGVDTDGNSNQGGLRIIKNATIEFARIGVRLFSGNFNPFSPSSQSGGYITADQATFRNNNRDIAGSTFNIYPNKSNLRRVKFEINNSTLDNNNSIKPRVELFSSRGIKFEGCTWSNTNATFLNANTQQVQNVTGILLRSSSCEVKEFTNGSNIQTSNFEGFIYGIRNLGITLEDMFIQNCIFRCYRGIYGVNWAEQSQVLKCRFENLNQAAEIGLEIPSAFINLNSGSIWNNSTTNSAGMTISSGPAYGLYLDACSNTAVQFNNFEILSNNESNQRVGCYVNNCASSSIFIFDNYFRGNTYGIRFLNVNRNSNEPTTWGTKFACNIFAENRRHVDILSASAQSNSGINSNIYSSLNTSYSNQFFSNSNPYFNSGRYIKCTNTGIHSFGRRNDELFGVFDQVELGSGSEFAVPNSNNNCGQVIYPITRSALAQTLIDKQQDYSLYKDNGNQAFYA